MPQQLVFAANTVDFWRQSLNGLIANVNFASANSFNVSGNVIVRGGSGSTLALNVANGQIYGNGYLLFSLNAISFIGIANNARLQNTTITIPTQLGLVANITTVQLGQTISINISSVNNISNTRTDLPVSANAIRWSMALANTNIANATLLTSGILPVNRGGTGQVTFANGETLIGNSQSGGLDKASITAGLGVALTTAAAYLRANLNITSGNRMNVATPTGNGAFIISANGYDLGTTSQAGLISLVDSYISTSVTQGVTANAANALIKYANANPGISNAYGRLLMQNVYTTSNFAGTYSPNGAAGNTRYTWNKHPNCAFVKIVAVGGGAAGSNTAAGTSASQYKPKPGGGSGAVIIGVWQAADFGTSETIQVGGGGYGTVPSGGGTVGDWSGFLNGQVKVAGGDSSGSSVMTVSSEHSEPFEGTKDTTTSWIANDPLVRPIIYRREPGESAILWADDVHVISGRGGSTIFGKGGEPVITRTTPARKNGRDGTGYGSGGSGCLVVGVISPGANSGNGAPGIVTIEQYSKI
jgi:hypothetical protein